VYGTTKAGGGGNSGTLFSVRTNGADFSTLHAFAAGDYDASFHYTNSDGAAPYGKLLLNGGPLYGTTEWGASSGSGTIFAVNTNGAGFGTLYTFTPLLGNTNLDGANPYAGLVLSGNTLYGTTYSGGSAGQGALIALSLATAPPWLDVHSSGRTAIFSWPSFSTGWTLQQSANLTAGSWTSCGYPVSDDGTNYTVTMIGSQIDVQAPPGFHNRANPSVKQRSSAEPHFSIFFPLGSV
jgi:uncharacterized repeat protein (TIGR03803 family)